MSGIPVGRFYPATSRSSTARSVKKQYHNEHSLHVPSDLFKSRSLSASTPVVNKHFPKFDSLPPRSLSTSFCSSIDDSGYSESFCDSSVYTPIARRLGDPQGSLPYSLTQDDVTNTPKQKDMDSFFLMRGINVEYTPIADLNSSFTESMHFKRTVSQDRVPMDFIQSDFETPEEENVYDKFRINTSFSIESIPKSKLCFESDFEDEDIDDFTSVPSSSHFETSGLAEQFDMVLKKFSPLEPDRLIGRKMGLSRVDILSELNYRNMSFVSVILDFLEPEDLCSACQVSREWKAVCDSSERNTRRRKMFLKKMRMPYSGRSGPLTSTISKENLGHKKKTRSSRGLTDSKNQEQSVLATVQFVGQTPVPAPKHPAVRQELFSSAVSNLKNDESLQECPKCRCPSRVLPVQDRGQCIADGCGFDFCTKCLNEFHSSRSCEHIGTKRPKTGPIGGKKSKKNLKRL